MTRRLLEVYDPSGTRWALHADEYIRISVDAPNTRDHKTEDGRLRIRIGDVEVFIPADKARILKRGLDEALESKASKFGVI